MQYYSFSDEELETARHNISFIKDQFTRVELIVNTLLDPNKESEIKEWIRTCPKGLVLGRDAWRLLTEYDKKEPSMEDILASIRRIISEDGSDDKRLVYFFLDPDDVVMFKLTWF